MYDDRMFDDTTSNCFISYDNISDIDASYAERRRYFISRNFLRISRPANKNYASTSRSNKLSNTHVHMHEVKNSLFQFIYLDVIIERRRFRKPEAVRRICLAFINNRSFHWIINNATTDPSSFN